MTTTKATYQPQLNLRTSAKSAGNQINNNCNLKKQKQADKYNKISNSLVNLRALATLWQFQIK